MKLFRILVLVALSHAAYCQVVINEICATNGDLRYESDFFDFPSWVELYNAGSSSVNVSGYYLSDDPANRTKWRIPSGTSIPANGHLLIWCDSRNTLRHTNFDLDPDGEELILSDATKEIDRATFPRQYLNVSWGRLTDGGATTGYITAPSPAARNNVAAAATQLVSPMLSIDAGRYASTQNVAITASASESEIRYTTDGSEPTPSSTLYSSPVVISKSTTLKAKVFKAGFIPSDTETRTYFINQHPFSLPVISISAKPQYFFDNSIGIMVDGTNGIPGNCVDQPRNWNQDWDRHAVFELFDRTGEKILDQHVDVRIGGGCSRNNPQKSLVVRARDKYGKKTIEYEFFGSKQINNFGGLMLRNSGNDFWASMMRDALMQDLVRDQMDVDYLAYKPAIIYINGAYWGIQEIREKVDGDYVEANFGVDRDDVDIIETWGSAIEGSMAHYAMFRDSLQRISIASPDAFKFIDRYIDVQEFINYLTAEIYYCNTDWPGNNVKFWRQRSTNGKFRWILWDLDFGMGVYDNASYPTHPTLHFATATDGPSWPNPPWSTVQIRLLLENPEFRNRFVQTLTTSLGTTFKPERVIDRINSFQTALATEYPYHAQRWGLSTDGWSWEVQRLRNFASARNTFMKDYVRSYFGLSDDVRISIQSFPAGAGGVRLNGVLDPAGVSDAFYFRDLPFTARAEPSAGYQFSHYVIRKTDVQRIELVARGSGWKYFDSGSLPSTGWMNAGFADASWQEGSSELGYGEGDEATVVSYGGNAQNKHVTTYFRKSFSVADTTGFSAITGRVLYDDGVIVYLNGEEVYRGNMPAGAVNYNTFAAANQDAEGTFFGFTIPKGEVLPGANVIAVEVHQTNASSSDVSFNLDLSVVRSGAQSETTTTTATLEDVAGSDVLIEAHFIADVPKTGLVINEVSAGNATLADNYGDTDDWIEIYNAGTQPVDLAGLFITDDRKSKLRHRIASGKVGETILAAGAYKLLWADDDVEQGPLHLAFKLSADGEDVGLYQMIGAEIRTLDEMSFGKQISTTSFSRIPNATGPFMLTASATPLAPNVFEIPVANEEPISETGVSLYPNPTDAAFSVVTEEGSADIAVFDFSGRTIFSKLSVRDGEKVSISDAAPGIYLVRVTTPRRDVFIRVAKR